MRIGTRLMLMESGGKGGDESCASASHAPHNGASVFAEPETPRPVIGEHALHLRPEAGRVIHLDPVAELVYDHVVTYLRRSKHQKTIKVQITAAAAASPAAFLIPYRDAAVADADKRRERRAAGGKILHGLIGECGELRPGESWLFGKRVTLPLLLQHPFEMRLKPLLLFREKTPELCFGHTKRSPDKNLSVRADLKRYGFSPAAQHGDRQLCCAAGGGDS